MRVPLTAMAGLAALAVLFPGCADPKRGDVQVFWTFAGQTCQQAGVDRVQVDVARELLTPNQFSCFNSDGSINAGADLGSFLFATYDLTVTGLSVDGAILYQSSQQFTVRGDTVVDIDVQPTGSIALDWTFAGQSCAQAGVTSVRISLDGQFVTDQSGILDLPCSSRGIDGTSISPLTPGTHSLYLVGILAGQPSYWLKDLHVSVTQSSTTSVQANLPSSQRTSALADVSWDALASGGGFALGKLGAMTCDEAQVDVVALTLDPNPDGSGGTLLAQLPCNSNGVEGVVISTIPAPGTHTFALSGFRNTIGGPTVLYRTLHPAAGVRFELGLVSNVDVDADALGSALGSAVLTWDFGGAACPGSFAYTLTDPSGSPQTGTAPCSGLPAIPEGPPTNVESGLWGFDATAGAFKTHILFAVPNQSSASWKIPFSR